VNSRQITLRRRFGQQFLNDFFDVFGLQANHANNGAVGEIDTGVPSLVAGSG
jgi:hypothetical protein